MQLTGTLPDSGPQPTNRSEVNQTTATQRPQRPESSVNDYMLLCSDEKGWLTTWEDLDVSYITSDKELFESIQSRLEWRRRWTRRFASLKSVQRISFVKVSDLHMLMQSCLRWMSYEPDK